MLSNILVPFEEKDVLIYVNQVRDSALMLKIAQKKFYVHSELAWKELRATAQLIGLR